MKILAALTVVLVCAASLSVTAAADLSGRVLFNSLPVPGATVTASRVPRSVVTTTDDDGAFRLVNVDDGTWRIRVEMRGFVVIVRDVTLPLTEATSAAMTFVLTMRPLEEIVSIGAVDQSAIEAPVPVASAAMSAAMKPDDVPDIINGSLINGAASMYAQPRAFGNNRPQQHVLYTGGFTLALGNSALNAKPYAFGGAAAATPDYSDVQAGFTLLGPLKIPGLITAGPQTSFTYQHGVLNNATTQSARMPTAAERLGDLSALTTTLRDPLTGKLFVGNTIPLTRISPQAAALLAYYPMPTGATANGANYQAPAVSTSTQDSVQLAMQQSLSARTNVGGRFEYQRTDTNATNLFGFTDTSRQTSLTASANWSRRFGRNTLVRSTYQFTHAATTVTPFLTDPVLLFPDIASLSDADEQRTIKSAHAIGAEAQLKQGRHNISIGGDLRRHRFDVASQPDARGTLSFTGAATGSAVGDFLLGIPATSSIAFGGGPLHLRGRSYDAYVNDDFRAGAGVTLNAGVRWEYESPYTTPTMTSALHPDRGGLEPRVGVSWRPWLADSFVLRANYGLYKNLGIYPSLGVLLAQQPPFTKTVSVQNTSSTPLSLANPFPSSILSAPTFAIDPDFRAGLVHSWSLSLQRDLPASLTFVAAYFGDRGTNLMQASLPNTYPAGAANPCPTCPSGFVYVTSNGTSSRNAAQFTLRRRLYAGFTATVQYTFAKSIDDAATFNNAVMRPTSLSIAQNWLDVAAERGPSSFDQRHLLAVQAQYTTGVGVVGGTLLDGVWGTLYKDWTLTSQFTAGSGLPFTPLAFVAIGGAGIVGVRPSLTGVSTAPVTPGSYVNPAAFSSPTPDTWGTAGRNSLRGPKPFSLDASLARVFRLRGRLNLEWRLAATNVLNRVTFAAVNPVVTSPQFGLPTVANQMRRIQMTFRLRF